MTALKPSFDLFTIGHSNIAADRFIGLLRSAGADAIADVRSTPFSRFCPWFSRKPLEARLGEEAMGYLYYGDALGGRPRAASFYRDGVADYEAMADDGEFRSALDRLRDDAAQHRLCLMCAERDPLDCHRFLLVARALVERGVAIGHILHDGAVEPQAATEARLLEWDAAATEGDLFAAGQEGRLAAAYRCRARGAAYRAKPAIQGATPTTKSR